jgi:hypothetical protein
LPKAATIGVDDTPLPPVVVRIPVVEIHVIAVSRRRVFIVGDLDPILAETVRPRRDAQLIEGRYWLRGRDERRD